MKEVLKRLFLKKKINEEMLDNSIKLGWITKEQKQEIIEGEQVG